MATVEIQEVNGLLATLADLQERVDALSEDRWMTVPEAADYLRCSPKHVYEITAQGKLAGVKDGSRNLYRRSAIDAYLEGKS